MTINPNYECSSEGGVRHWEIPYASLEDATPVVTDPAEVLGTDGLQLTGTVMTIDAGLSIAVIDFTPSMVYRHDIRNVLTYNGAVENTWGAITIGLPVYYDNSATMPADVHLSLAAANNLAQANTIFGWVVPADENDVFPKGVGGFAGTYEQAVMQHGA